MKKFIGKNIFSFVLCEKKERDKKKKEKKNKKENEKTVIREKYTENDLYLFIYSN